MDTATLALVAQWWFFALIVAGASGALWQATKRETATRYNARPASVHALDVEIACLLALFISGLVGFALVTA